jgi:hypothetical protein
MRNFAETFFHVLRLTASAIVPPMTSHDFLSTAFVVVLLTGVALLAVASAVTLAPFDRFDRHRGKVFLGCMVGIWAVAVLVIWLVERTT